jgi:hypothetical protein
VRAVVSASKNCRRFPLYSGKRVMSPDSIDGR